MSSTERTTRLPAAGETRLRKSREQAVVNVVTYVVILLGSVIFAAPFLWMVSTSLKPLETVYATPPVWIPNPPLWKNYLEATTTFPFWRFGLNTLLIASTATAGKLLSGSLAGYAFARLRWPGRDIVFLAVLATIMLPSMVTLVPTYMLFNKLGWMNTYLPLIVPFWFISTPYSIFLIRQYYMTIPTELSEAARIDGASEFRIYWQIILPLSVPVFVALGVLSFVRHWNELLEPLIYLTRQDMLTIAIGLLRFRAEVGTYYHLLMAASILSLIPILILFFLAQRYFVEGITLTGIKG